MKHLLNTLYIFLKTILWGRYYHYPHFTKEEPEAQRGKGTCPETHRRQRTDAGFKLRPEWISVSSVATILCPLCLTWTDAFLPTVCGPWLQCHERHSQSNGEDVTDTYVPNASVFSLLERLYYVRKIARGIEKKNSWRKLKCYYSRQWWMDYIWVKFYWFLFFCISQCILFNWKNTTKCYFFKVD